jgi:hypothetical protein
MRPSWQIDLKWMLGLAACALIVVSGSLYSLSYLTQRDTAIPIASALVSAGIADRVSDQEYAQVQAAAQSAPADTVSLSPVALSLNGSEIAGMDKQSASAVVGGKLAGVMYDNGEAAAKALIVTPPPETGQGPVKLGPVGALTASNHSLFTQLFLASVAVALLALGGVAMLARGWGRLGAPSFIMAIGTAPLAALWVLGKSAIGTAEPGEGLFAQNARASFDSAASDLTTLFMALTAVALVCGLLCILGSAVSMAATKAVNGPLEEPAAPEPEPAPKPNVPRPQVQAQGLMRASASLAATTYRVSGTTQAVPKSEASTSQQNVA